MCCCDSERLHWRQGFHSHQAFVNPPLEHLLEVVYNMLSWIVFGNSEQDEFASLPPIIPEGPIAILGLVCFSSALHSSILFGC